MESLGKNRSRERLVLASFFLLLFILIGLTISLYFNYRLQEQIYERDVLIQDLTQRDSILNNIMEFEYDSTSKTTSWKYRLREGKIIKYNDLAKELDSTSIDYNRISKKHEKISKENSQNVDDYNSLSRSFNSLIGEYNGLVNQLNEKTDSLSSFKLVVQSLQSKYNVEYEIGRRGGVKEVTIKSSKIDSGLILLPYFRDRLKYDSQKKVWIINITK